MPFYEYQCQNCQHQFEALQKINDEPIKQCPECGKNKVQRLVSAAGFQLKGGGWYVTDFRDKDKKKTTSSDKTETKTASSDKTDKTATEKPLKKTEEK